MRWHQAIPTLFVHERWLWATTATAALSFGACVFNLAEVVHLRQALHKTYNYTVLVENSHNAKEMRALRARAYYYKRLLKRRVTPDVWENIESIADGLADKERAK